MSAPVLHKHEVVVSSHPGGHKEVSCKGCGYSTTRRNDAAASLVAERHSNLNKRQFGAK